MDANDEVSNVRREPDEPEGSASPTPAPVQTAQPAEPATEPAPPAPPAPPGRPASQPTTGIAALPLPYQIAVALALAVVAVGACAHLVLVFLHIAPSNTLTKQHGQAVDEWVYPEFEQNWKLFAPNPLQQNIAVQVRAEVRTSGGEVRTTGWYNLSAQDGAAIDGNLIPSHTQQNELRRAWDFYVASHDAENRATTSRGELSERYLRRIVMLRLDREEVGGADGVIDRIQVRSRTTNVRPPDWSEETVSEEPVVRELSWWTVTDSDRMADDQGDADRTGASAQ
ncbi:DUF5819 family protein [Streptomyces sp. NPDC002643]